MGLRNVTLELSAKAFKDDSEREMRDVCRKMFRQWEPLIQMADRLSVMLWLGDGSEILEYTANPDDTFEWGYWQGIASAPMFITPETEHAKRNINLNPLKYRPDAAPRTYRWLKQLTCVIRDVVVDYGKELQIGATFDNGPEFVVSDFKYGRHREIARADSLFPKSFVVCNAVLDADSHAYAAFPDGIPAGTSLGTFLGAQYRLFAKDLGFDYLWLSNGMGFGLETWGLCGALFNGGNFFPEKREQAKRELLKFWDDLLAAAPGIRIETRGSNFTAGVEMSTDAAPLAELYRRNLITVPVNSPASAIYFNTGLTNAAWMSHIAELPRNGDIPFRYYTHDPWFLNTPWLDRYGREPWDLFPVMAIARVTGEGALESANRVAFLSCDNSYGDMPDVVPAEVIPLVEEACRTRPDAPGALLWIYPFEEYAASETLQHTFCEECFLVDALQAGLPLNTVISTGNFRRLATEQPEWFRQTDCVVPAECLRTECNFCSLQRVVESGGNVIVYGTIAGLPPEAVRFLGLASGSPLSGEVTVRGEDVDFCRNGEFCKKVDLLPVLHDGPLCELPAGTTVLAEAEQAGETRVLACVHSVGSGKVGFVRTLSPYLEDEPAAHNSTLRQSRRLKGDGNEKYPACRLLRAVWAKFGWSFRACLYEARQSVPRMTLSRHDGAFLFNGYTPDTTVSLKISTPYGVPLPIEREVRVEDGEGIFQLEKAPRFSCRAFLAGQDSGIISCKTLHPDRPGTLGRLDVIGLDGGDLRFFPPPDCGEVVAVRRDFNGIFGPVHSASGSQEFVPMEEEVTPHGRCCRFENVSGVVNIIWRRKI